MLGRCPVRHALRDSMLTFDSTKPSQLVWGQHFDLTMALDVKLRHYCSKKHKYLRFVAIDKLCWCWCSGRNQSIGKSFGLIRNEPVDHWQPGTAILGTFTGLFHDFMALQHFSVCMDIRFIIYLRNTEHFIWCSVDFLVQMITGSVLKHWSRWLSTRNISPAMLFTDVVVVSIPAFLSCPPHYSK